MRDVIFAGSTPVYTLEPLILEVVFSDNISGP
jgi:hypothetical protein